MAKSDPCVLATALQLKFTPAGSSDLHHVASWWRPACCTGRMVTTMVCAVAAGRGNLGSRKTDEWIGDS